MPNDIQRSFHLMRELDKDSTELHIRLSDMERRYLSQSKKKLHGVKETNPEERLKIIEDKQATEDIANLRALIMTKQREKVDVANQISEMIDQHMRLLKVDMGNFQTELRETGEYDFLGARKGDSVAFKQNVYETHFVLGKVAAYRGESGSYEVVDVDDDLRVYTLPETQVVLLNPGSEAQRLKYQKGDEVFAVYPETTSFYLGTIAQPPRRGVGHGGPGHDVPKLAVQFQDDADDTGFTPIRWVPVQHIFKAI